MAQSMHEIKDKISSTQSMSKITKAMEMVSAAKLTKSEIKTKNYGHYMESLEMLMNNISKAPSLKNHTFFNPNQGVRCTGYLIITSDRGLAGGYNNNVLKLLQQEITTLNEDAYKLYMIGSKGFDYVRRAKLKVENEFVFIPDDVIYTDIEPVVKQILKDYLDGKISKIVVVYNDYLSKIIQEPTLRQLLPLTTDDRVADMKSSYLFEPDEDEVINSVLPKYLEGTIYGLVVTAKLSENAARMNAMQNATDNALEIIKDSQLVYNRARQAAITQELTEIVGGASALE